MNLPDDEMRDIANPWNEMQLHVSYKCAEALSVLGLGVGLAVSRKPNRLRKAGRAAFLGALVGAGPVGVLMWSGKARSLNDEDIYDRAYRVRYNRNQIRIDNAYKASAQLGLVGGLLMTRSLSGTLADIGLVSVLGVLGSISYIAYAKPDKQSW
ncbi:unnamed protein product [Effrenium voratum]|nr:unnamed protein product [Effrenium voratum]